MTDLIVKSGVQDALSEHPISSDFCEALDEEVAELLEDASQRADANDRNTVMPQDL
jgi:histone H3/H4